MYLKGNIMSNIKVSMITLGCSKNLVDAECMLSILKENNFSISESISDAEVIIVNTCGFIEDAKKEAIDAILYAADFKEEGQCKYIIVTGCLPQRYAKDILSEFPEVDAVLGTAHYKDIATVINDLYQNSSRIDLSMGVGGIDHLREIREITTSTYAWLKIGEGCRNKCHFCAIPIIRGEYVSRNSYDIIAEATNLASRGYKEIILAAQDTTNYGIDFDGKRHLHSLLQELSRIDGIERIRIMYGYMDGMYDELISEIKNNDKICKYVDIPIQHGCDSMLKRMNRRDTEEKITEVITKLRNEIPNIVIRTTVMVGYPGETEEEFNKLIENLKIWKFDRLGCFTYSPEEGTIAADMDIQVDEEVKSERQKIVYDVQKAISYENNQKRMDSIVKVCIDSISEDGIFYMGRSYAEAPDVDPMIYVIAQDEQLQLGKSYDVRIVECSEYDITGVTV